MNELQIFNSEEFGEIRTVTIDNEPWFVGKDVALALGYSNASKAVSVHVEEEDRILKVLEADSQNGNVVKTQTALINESGLYALMQAVVFKQGGLFMDYKKEIIELLDKVKLESTLKRVYKLLVYLYLREKQPKMPHLQLKQMRHNNYSVFKSSGDAEK